jgi:prephenate dehydrogenase
MNSTIGIIGFGAFGKTLSQLISPLVEILVYDPKEHANTPLNVRFVSLKEVASCNIIILAVTLDQLLPVCQQLAEFVKPTTTVMDTCSVKVRAAEILIQTLSGKCRLLATHPLFGPQAVQENNGSAKSLKLVWYELSSHSFKDIRTLFKQELGVEIIHMSPEQHDKEMAWVHALTFFTGRALLQMNPPKSALATGYYKKLLDLVELESQHSEALFISIQQGNPFAAEVRREFLQSAQTLEKTITEK